MSVRPWSETIPEAKTVLAAAGYATVIDHIENQLATAREGLVYVLEHHLDGAECLCDAARSTAEAALRLSTDEVDASPETPA